MVRVCRPQACGNRIVSHGRVHPAAYLVLGSKPALMVCWAQWILLLMFAFPRPKWSVKSMDVPYSDDRAFPLMQTPELTPRSPERSTRQVDADGSDDDVSSLDPLPPPAVTSEASAAPAPSSPRPTADDNARQPTRIGTGKRQRSALSPSTPSNQRARCASASAAQSHGAAASATRRRPRANSGENRALPRRRQSLTRSLSEPALERWMRSFSHRGAPTSPPPGQLRILRSSLLVLTAATALRLFQDCLWWSRLVSSHDHVLLSGYVDISLVSPVVCAVIAHCLQQAQLLRHGSGVAWVASLVWELSPASVCPQRTAAAR